MYAVRNVIFLIVDAVIIVIVIPVSAVGYVIWLNVCVVKIVKLTLAIVAMDAICQIVNAAISVDVFHVNVKIQDANAVFNVDVPHVNVIQDANAVHHVIIQRAQNAQNVKVILVYVVLIVISIHAVLMLKKNVSH